MSTYNYVNICVYTQTYSQMENCCLYRSRAVCFMSAKLDKPGAGTGVLQPPAQVQIQYCYLPATSSWVRVSNYFYISSLHVKWDGNNHTNPLEVVMRTTWVNINYLEQHVTFVGIMQGPAFSIAFLCHSCRIWIHYDLLVHILGMNIRLFSIFPITNPLW